MTRKNEQTRSGSGIPPVLVTGAAGFLGSAIVLELRAMGAPVRATDVAGHAPDARVEYAAADLLRPGVLAPLLEGRECVVHAAGLAHRFGKDRWDRASFIAVNADVAASVARAAAAAGVRRFVHLSSVSVYGAHSAEACDESFPCRPEGAYAESKYLAERGIAELARTAGMSLAILRLTTAYGEGDRGNIARLMRSIDQGRFFWIGSGANRKSLIHREDVARACVAVLLAPMTGVSVYNVTAPSCAVREIVESLAAALGRRLPGWHVPGSMAGALARAAGALAPKQSRVAVLCDTLKKWLVDDVYDGSKIQRAIGFKTEVELTDGLRREVEWCRRQNT